MSNLLLLIHIAIHIKDKQERMNADNKLSELLVTDESSTSAGEFSDSTHIYEDVRVVHNLEGNQKADSSKFLCFQSKVIKI